MDDDLKAYYGISGSGIIIAEDFDAIISEEKVFQIMMGCYPREYQTVMEGVRHARIAAWWDRAVDIIPSSGEKASPLRKSSDTIIWKKTRRWPSVMATTT